ncbi:MAG TPA: proline--tRNA ligase [Leptospiraceae bacterium]|nr:proline--tRNA ligase [Leptospiraceae bacterium]
MKASDYILPTTKENPSDAVVASHILMVRAGLIRKSTSGLYHYLPMGFRILKKIENIVREEMDGSGALEFVLPILTPAELWEKSGRWERMGKEMFRLQDRHNVNYSLGPTHEESFSDLMKPILKSYKDLPKNVYQIHTKFRDEVRPRFGVIRSREFIMKDAYSFHLDQVSLDSTYEVMRKTYRMIFQRCGLKTVPVQADSGSMGGSGSEEFMVISPIGEETLSICGACGYAGNVEKTPVVLEKKAGSDAKLEKVSTPDKKGIEEVAQFMSVHPSETVKAVYLKADNDKNVIVFIRGDRELNEVKLNNLLGTLELRPLGDAECKSLGLVAGYVGPGFSSTEKIKFFFDSTLQPDVPYVTGANEEGFHFKGYILNRDYGKEIKFHDLAKSETGDPCPSCGKPIVQEKGIEVGHIFKLGEKYTKAFDIKVSDKNGKMSLVTMGCYGIGVNRTMATVIEQSNDEKGIIWPISIAPFEVSYVSITKGDEQNKKAEEIYNVMKKNKVEVFWDDRDLGPGFKFKDSEIVGFPVRITAGKNFFEKNELSILNRKTGEEKTFVYSEQSLLKEISELREKLYRELGV